ncbi:MAG TPA: glutamate synthase-related protein, partial [Vicinamibacterales bacterium]|nr:glutamate synthase-related protein [Vicinamibacterales bacterium]
EAYAAFSELVRRRPPTALRDLLDFAPATPCPIEDVEPVEAICRRFFGSAMSVGALSPEAHRTIAVALNRLGARSNSGEGGEEPERFARRAGEPWANSATKQVASARFGVTPAYLVAAEELQIKIAQGSKPGEGGQLPAIKVVPHIARLRHVEPGVPLISPPPHHDIYSIEDLAQLIYDLRALNPRARIGVKLVAQAGVGIVAAGVAKAGADAIQISGHDGGTGASPRLSIRHAGLPWELGLAEAHQVLRHNGLRDRVVLQVDGGLKTGHDIVKAAALGAEEFGFGTALLVAVGCAMARQCHSNTCPVGIATQREDLRARFRGTPEMVEAYLRFVAEEVRALLAALGVRRLEDLVGRGDVLVRRPGERRGVDLSGLLVRAPLEGRPTGRSAHPAHAARVFDDQWLADVEPALGRRPVVIRARVTPADRAIGARIAGLITARFGDAGLDDSRAVRLELTGSAGQSFGAFAVAGLHLVLTGEANDGVAKGMRGGLVAIRPPGVSSASPVLAGNAVLYGATGGRVFIAGAAGERFAVRNSGAAAVVEGVGDHGCEYMTAGLVVVIGAIGRNFGAGMTGGAAYVTGDPDEVASRLNPADARALPLAPDDERRLRALLEAHQALTRSARAAQVLAAWSDARRAFSKVVPAAAALRAHGVPAACAG